MAIPQTDASGWLPEGVHSISIEELKEGFGSFKSTDCRPVLFSKFETYLDELVRLDIASAVYVDGSFASAKPSPEDIDIVLCLREEFALRSDWTPMETNLVTRAFVKRRYKVDLFTQVGELACAARTEMFAHKKPPDEGRKGILLVRL